jgi:triosephosphate isomerase
MYGRKPLIAGNWKMNLRIDESVRLVEAIADEVKALEGVDVLVAPPFTSLHAVKAAGVTFPISMLERVIEAIEKAANTGKIGDGKIFVTSLEQVVRIRTGESGPDAL